MPAIALFTNIVWEVYWVFIANPPAELGGPAAAGAQKLANACWLLLNLIILYQFFRFGRAQFKSVSRSLFFGSAVTILIIAALLMPAVQQALEPQLTSFPGFAQNILMSALFLSLLASRKTLSGQSIFVAVSKLLGSFFACTSIIIAVRENSPLQAEYTYLLTLSLIIILILDGAYLIAVVRLQKVSLATGSNTDSYELKSDS